jgi:hypothetical protein
VPELDDSWQHRKRQYRWLCAVLWLLCQASSAVVIAAHASSKSPERLAAAAVAVAILTGLIFGAMWLHVGRLSQPPDWDSPYSRRGRL